MSYLANDFLIKKGFFFFNECRLSIVALGCSWVWGGQECRTLIRYEIVKSTNNRDFLYTLIPQESTSFMLYPFTSLMKSSQHQHTNELSWVTPPTIFTLAIKMKNDFPFSVIISTHTSLIEIRRPPVIVGIHEEKKYTESVYKFSFSAVSITVWNNQVCCEKPPRMKSGQKSF